MKKWFLISLITITSTICATYNPATNTYTVDENGCVSAPNLPQDEHQESESSDNKTSEAEE